MPRLTLPLGGVFDHRDRNVEAGHGLTPVGAAQHVAHGVRVRLALLSGEEALQGLDIGREGPGDGEQRLAPLGDGGCGPGREGGAGGGDGLVELGARAVGGVGHDLLIGGIENRKRACARDAATADGQGVVGVKVDGHGVHLPVCLGWECRAADVR